MTKVLLIDGSNYLFRAYHALPALTTSAGEPTGAMKGFLGMLSRVQTMTKPDLAAIVFDAPGKTFRHEMYPDYKANRPPMPDDLRVQIEPLKAIVRELGWPLVCVSGIEADDVIGTLATRAAAQGMDVVVATGDKDLSQLVNERIVILNTMNTKLYDREGVKEKYGVYPERIIDYLALMGDKVDNVPGIAGCGPKTAAKWVNEFGSLDEIVRRADEVSGKIGEKLRAGLGELDLGRALVTVKCDAEIPGVDSLEALRFVEPDAAALSAFGIRWEIGLSTVLRAAAGGADAAKRAAQAIESGEALSRAAKLGREKAAESAESADAADMAAFAQGSLFDEAPSGAEAAAAPVKALRPRSGKNASSAAPRAEVLPAAAATPTAHVAVTVTAPAENPDEIPFTALDSREALEALANRLATCALPAAVVLLYDGRAQKPDFAGLAIATSPKDVFVVMTSVSLGSSVIAEVLGPWLASDAPKVFHDAKAALHVLAHLKCAVGGTIDDTMLMDYVLEAHLGHELSKLAARTLGRRVPSAEDVLGKGAKRLPWRECEEGALMRLLAEEAAAVRGLWSVLDRRLARDAALLRVYETIERPLMPVLFRMEREGVALDCRLLLEESKELAVRIEALEREAYETAGREFNMASPKQLAEILFAELGCPVVKKTASGTPSTDEEVLTELALDYPLPKIILEYRRLTKLRSTYLEKLPKMTDGDGRIRTTFGQATAVTGRLASSEPNLQNIPARTPEGRRIREAFEARPGWTIVDADYSQIELRIMAHLSGDEGLLSAFARGEDIHRSTASEVFATPIEQVTSDERRMAKVINFGLIYGMSAFGLAQQLGLDRKVAAAYVDEYFRRFPGVKRYMERTRAAADAAGFVETVFGRRLWLPEIRSGRRNLKAAAERAAINAPMQGTAADLIKLAMIAVDRWLAEENLKTRLILQVHDELVLEAPPEEVERVRTMLPKLMAEVAELAVPLIAEVGTGPNWGAAH